VRDYEETNQSQKAKALREKLSAGKAPGANYLNCSR
jgi:hypothetical protein